VKKVATCDSLIMLIFLFKVKKVATFHGVEQRNLIDSNFCKLQIYVDFCIMLQISIFSFACVIVIFSLASCNLFIYSSYGTIRWKELIHMQQLFCDVIFAYFNFDLLIVNDRDIILHKKEKKRKEKKRNGCHCGQFLPKCEFSYKLDTCDWYGI
jgi:hypothetical protein